MKIALAQLNPTVGDLAENAELVRAAAVEAAGQQAELFVASELVLSGYPPRDLLLRQGFVEACDRMLEQLASQLPPGIGVLVGHPTGRGVPQGRVANAASLLFDGKVVATIHKALLPNYDVFDERRYFYPAADVAAVQFRGVQLGIHICEDAWWGQPGTPYHDEPYRHFDPVAALARDGADLFINLSASPFEIRKRNRRQQLVAEHAKKHGRPFVFVNQVGGNDDLVFDGASFAVSADGQITDQLSGFESALQFVEVELPTSELPNDSEAARRDPDDIPEPIARRMGIETDDASARHSYAYVEDSDIVSMSVADSGYEVIDLNKVEVPDDIIALLPESAARESNVIPFRLDGSSLVVAISDPMKFDVIDKLRFLLNREVKCEVATDDAIERAIARHYGEQFCDSVGTGGMEAIGEIKLPDAPNLGDMLDALILGLRDYVRKCGFTDCVLGLSGGIDSTLAAYIAAKAVGPEHVHGIAMPSRHSSQHSIDDAKALAVNLGIDYAEIPIDAMHQAHEQTVVVGDDLTSQPGGLADQNLQARIRGGIVMTRSNRHNWLALATGNKSELSVGYCTLYGDMCGGFAVLSDVFKRDVYGLSRFINDVREGREVLPENSISKPPSAELAPDQFDQDTLPDYPTLDGILIGLIEREESIATLSKTFDPEIVQWVATRLDRNEFKRRQMPPGIKLSARAFGTGRRMPMAARYRED